MYQSDYMRKVRQERFNRMLNVIAVAVGIALVFTVYALPAIKYFLHV